MDPAAISDPGTPAIRARIAKLDAAQQRLSTLREEHERLSREFDRLLSALDDGLDPAVAAKLLARAADLDTQLAAIERHCLSVVECLAEELRHA
jgi:hypothetical protein